MRNKKRKNYAQYFGNFMTSEWSWITHFWDMEGGEKLRFRAKGLCKEMNGWDVLGFYSCPIGLPKFLLSKPVPGSKIVAGEGERSEKNSAMVWIMIDLWQFSSASATWTILFMSSSSWWQKHSCACSFTAGGFLPVFFFSSCDPVSSCWMHCDEIYATLQTTC